MNKELELSIIFASGIAVGAVSTWFIVKNRFEKKAEEEINEIRNYYSEKEDKLVYKKIVKEEKPRDITSVHPSSTVAETDANLDPVGFADLIEAAADILENYGHEPDEKFMSIYEIDGDDFGELDNYETITLTWFLEDNVVCDDMMEPLDDKRAIVGDQFDPNDGKETFGGIRYIRNENLHSDYEIVIEEGKYSDYILKHPSASTIAFYDGTSIQVNEEEE